MSCQPIEIYIPGSIENRGGLLCTTTGTLFGPLFKSIDDALEFDEWVTATRRCDPRSLRHDELIQAKAEWEATRECE